MKPEVINRYFNGFNKFVYEVDGLEFSKTEVLSFINNLKL